MRPFRLSDAGLVLRADGASCSDLEEIDSTQIEVPHLTAHVERWTLPKGDNVGVLIQYSCHCWTSAHDPEHHADELRIMDGTRARVLDPQRFEASCELPDLIRQLDQHRIYVTAAERNYGVYNMAFTAADGLHYTAFFAVKPRKGRFNGERHSLRLFVESAYTTVQPQEGMKTKLSAVLAMGLQNKMVRYKR